VVPVDDIDLDGKIALFEGGLQGIEPGERPHVVRGPGGRAGVGGEEVARYTKAAEQKKLARPAIAKLPGAEGHGIDSQNLEGRFGKEGVKTNEFNAELVKWRPVGASNTRGKSSA
jgi:hypothetical protein